MKEPLLKVVNLKTYLSQRGRLVYAVDGVDFEILPGETLGLVGESGCGKTITALSIIGLVPGAPGIVEGEIWFTGSNLLAGIQPYSTRNSLSSGTQLSNRIKARRWRKRCQQAMKAIRGKRIGMVFQDPVASLDPLFCVGSQITEVVLAHSDRNRREASAEAEKWLDDLQVNTKGAKYSRKYPYELSGGMRQRVSIAAALAGDPSLLIADEPTTALDVTIQAKVLHLLQDIKEKSGLSILLIGHDMSVISALADKVAVMYNGRIVERGDSRIILDESYPHKHPYTRALLEAAPSISDNRRLSILPEDVPDNTVRASHCRFAPRCKLKAILSRDIQEKCNTEEPGEYPIEGNHTIRCWNWAGSANQRLGL